MAPSTTTLSDQPIPSPQTTPTAITPTRLQFLLAGYRPFTTIWVFASIALYVFIIVKTRPYSLDGFPSFLLLLILMLPFVLMVAAVLTRIVLVLMLGLFKYRMKRNGYPFALGDTVMILKKGPHHGKTGQVYELWTEQMEVRVDVGKVSRRAVEDVFGGLDVCLVSRVAPDFVDNYNNLSADDGAGDFAWVDDGSVPTPLSTRWQSYFAQNRWANTLAIVSGLFGALVFAIVIRWSSLRIQSLGGEPLWIAWAWLWTPAFGLASATLLDGFIRFAFRPIFERRAKINWSPFQKGDIVMILRQGEFAGRLASVYAVDPSDKEFGLRVDLVRDPNLKYKNLFGPMQVCLARRGGAQIARAQPADAEKA